MGHDDIRIGCMIPPNAKFLAQVLEHGFESFQVSFWQASYTKAELKKLAKEMNAVLDAHAEKHGERPVISSLGPFGNPLQEKTQAAMWRTCIDAAEFFDTDLIAGFAGALEDRPVDESMGTFKKVFGPLAKRAADRGVKLAFENCDMHGTWERPRFNIAHAPRAWEMMFDVLGDPANVGLEWEPAHQLCSFIDPLPQLRQWVHKVLHLHGKDATVMWDLVKTKGIRGGETLVYHRTPGFGDTNWTDVISILRMAGFRGTIDIEGNHDPVYKDDLEMTGQVHALNYLKQCRGGAYVPNPTT
ncbi:MAG: sugar phosphate isomerase/epimerase family protein [Planctomycetota bacterium]